MLKFITNLSCVFNLAVIFMLTSSQPVNDQHTSNRDDGSNVPIMAISGSNSAGQQASAQMGGGDATSKANTLIAAMKTKNTKLNAFDTSFLNSSVVPFLDNCTDTDILCIAYFDMLIRLANTTADGGLNLYKKELQDPDTTNDKFCPELIAVIPDDQFSTDTSIASKLKNERLCGIICFNYNMETSQINIKPICTLILWGYKHSKIVTPKPFNILSPVPPGSDVAAAAHSSTPKPVQHAHVELKSAAHSASGNDAAILAPIVSQPNAPAPPNNAIETHESNPASDLEKSNIDHQKLAMPKAESHAKVDLSNPPVPSDNKPLSLSVMPQPGHEKLASSKNPVDTADKKPSQPHEITQSIADIANKEDGDIFKSDVNIEDTKSEKSDKKDDISVGVPPPVNNEIVNPIVNGISTSSVSPFISNGNVLDGDTVNAPPSDNNNDINDNNDDEGDLSGEEDEETNPNGDSEKSGETEVINNNDILVESKPVARQGNREEDGVYGKYGKIDDGSAQQQLDPFTEDTDSNFFTYFMFLMVLCIMLYVVYHNKTKVLALVLEGRRGSQHGRGGGGGGIGRRKHTAAYRKLDSNLEEAITSNASGRTTQIIY